MTKTIEIPEPVLREVRVDIEGVSPLLCNRFSEASIAAIVDKQSKKGTTGKAARDPEAEFRASLYPIDEGEYGFPASGVKKSLAAAGYRFAGQPMTETYGAINLLADMLPIRGDEPRMDSRMARLPKGPAMMAYRGRFDSWAMEIPIRYNANAISLEQLLNLVNLAGFSVGIGAFRPEKKGIYGQFRIDGVREVG